MRTPRLVALCSAMLFLVWTIDPGAPPSGRSKEAIDAGVPGPDIVQHTCALEVLLALHWVTERRVFDSATTLPLDAPPNGALACLPPPTE